MLFKKGDWIWFVDKYGTHLLPVGIGMPCIPITKRFTKGSGLMITENGLHRAGASVYNTLANVSKNNTHIIDRNKKEYIYLCSFTSEQLVKKVGLSNNSISTLINRAEILRLNSKYESWGNQTKYRIDAHTIQFINQWLEEKPMKAEDKIESVTAKYEAITDEKGILTLKDTGDREITLKVPIWKRIKYERYTNSDGKIRTKRVDKWVITGYKQFNVPPIIEKPFYVFKIHKMQRYQTYIKRWSREWIDPKTFSGDITRTTWLKMPDQTYHFRDFPNKLDVGIKTFNIVKYSLKKYLDKDFITDDRITRFAELRLLKYPRSRFTLRRYGAILNRMRNWKMMERMVMS